MSTCATHTEKSQRRFDKVAAKQEAAVGKVTMHRIHNEETSQQSQCAPSQQCAPIQATWSSTLPQIACQPMWSAPHPQGRSVDAGLSAQLAPFEDATATLANTTESSGWPNKRRDMDDGAQCGGALHDDAMESRELAAAASSARSLLSPDSVAGHRASPSQLHSHAPNQILTARAETDDGAQAPTSTPQQQGENLKHVKQRVELLANLALLLQPLSCRDDVKTRWNAVNCALCAATDQMLAFLTIDEQECGSRL